MTLFNKRRARLLVPGFHPDPSVCSDRPGHLVLAFSSFEYFPGLPVWESTDGGATWSFCSHAASRPDQFTATPLGNSRGFYAPTIRWHEGRYYLIVTDVNRGAMIFTTTDLHARWDGPVMVDGWPGIDPSLLFDEDGTCYICGNESGTGEKPGIYAAPIDPDTGTVLGPRHFLIGGITGANPEGPHLYRRDGRYYLMWAEGGTEAGHMECLARADSVFGPYETDPANPILTNRSTHLDPQCIGHADLAPLGDGTGEDFLVFLGLRTNADYPQQGWLGRENFGARVRWENGWPRLADQSFFIDADDRGCALPYEDPSQAWICPGVDRRGLFHVCAADGGAVCVGLAPLAATDPGADFDPTAGPRLIGRRQTSMDDHLTVVLPVASSSCAAPGNPGNAVPCGTTAAEDLCLGLIAYANHAVWADAFLRRMGAGRGRLVCRLYDKGVLATLADVPVSLDIQARGTIQEEGAVEGAIRLEVRGDDHGYTFTADTPGGRILLGCVPCEPFASTHAGGFTGMLLGVYARGAGFGAPGARGLSGVGGASSYGSRTVTVTCL